MLIFSNALSAQRNPLLTDLRHIREEVLKESRTMTALPPEQRGRHLLSLFQKDLLVGVSGDMLDSPSPESIVAKTGQAVSIELKIFGWAFIAIYNFSLLFYILLFAINQSSSRQCSHANNTIQATS